MLINYYVQVIKVIGTEGRCQTQKRLVPPCIYKYLYYALDGNFIHFFTNFITLGYGEKCDNMN